MTVKVCSLKYDASIHTQQLIPPREYTIVRFPFGVNESSDEFKMHQVKQPNNLTSKFNDPTAGLIWPAVDGWGRLYGFTILADADHRVYADRFARSPLGTIDTTATQKIRTFGEEIYITRTWGIFVNTSTPLAYMIYHDASRPVKLLLAEFKLEIEV